MPPLLIIFNQFIEDTCVVTVAAYLLGRGQILTSLYRARDSRQDAIRLGLVLGCIGLTEVIFPGARYPYKTDMLATVYGCAVGGLAVGIPTVAIVSLGSLILQSHFIGVETTCMLTVAALMTSALRRAVTLLGDTVGRVVLGSMTQAAVVFLETLVAYHWHTDVAPVGDIASIPANAFGLIIFQVSVQIAWERRRNEELRVDAERSKAMMTQAQLAALRARIHPHFLYNALTSIAALCRIAPEKAERAIVNLGGLMRNTLEASASTTIPLGQEIASVGTYLEIEQNRLGDRLLVMWDIQPSDRAVDVPPFALQTMVENAIKHGIAPKIEPSELRIIVRHQPKYTWIAALDLGQGMSDEERRRVTTPTEDIQHGLQLLSRQLELLYGRRSRVRLFSKPDRGTLVAFAVPTAPTVTDSILPRPVQK